jgi:DNA-binding response OmpR family regulator
MVWIRLATVTPGLDSATARERLSMATKLLLVEDSLSIQTIVETTFTREGFEVMVVGDALDGLHKAQTLRPDIVLADASMPGMDGFQLCQRIRQSAGGRHVPVVLLTSGFAAYDRAKGDHAGVTTHLAKPFEPQVLLDMVKQLVQVVPRPASPLATIATILPRPDGDPFETAMSSVREHAENDTPLAARLSMERVDAGAVSRSEESEMAIELLGDTWSNVAIPPAPSEVSQPAEPFPRAQDTQPRVSNETVSLNVLYQTLGRQMVQMLCEALDAHLTTMLAQLTPHLLETVRDVVQAKMPDLLEVLLQQEIDKLKQAVEQDQHDA